MPGRIAERVIWVGAAAILAIAAAGAVTYSRVQLLSEAAGWVDRTEHVRVDLQATLSALQDAESAVRGFVITHEGVFLQPLDDALPLLDVNLASLKGLVTDGPEEVGRVRSLDQLAHLRLARLQDVVKSVRDGTFVLPSPLTIGGAPLPAVAKSYTGPVSNDAVSIALGQHIDANDALRTGSYSKTLTFTLSTTTP